jgi:acetyl coenzyme A synthetase (ADP forming)-like protein
VKREFAIGTLDSIFYPKSVAVIGASRTPGKVGYELLSNLKGGGFEGRIIPVNPRADEILGLPCYGTIADYGSPADLTVIAVPAPSVADAVRSSIQTGTRAIIVVTAGFGESGSQGILMQAQIAQLCADAKVRLLGPNCLGLINTSHRLNASFSRYMPKAGGISVLSQSGALCTAVLDWAHARDVGLAKVVSIGNRADINETDILRVLAADEQTQAVIGYLESIAGGDEFIHAARALTSSKPFILLRAGTTRAGMWAACAHTGNLAGADPAYAAAFKRAGIIRAETLDCLFDCALAFSGQPLPRGDRVAVITNSGGPAVMAADAIERSGLRLAKLDGRAMEKLRGELPSAAGTCNPIDMLGDADPRRYAAAVAAAQHDECVDAIVVILTPHAMTQPAETIQAVATQTNGDKPLLLVYIGEPNGRRWGDGNLPVYSSPERAVAALHAMYEYRLWRSRPEYVVTRFPVNRRRVERIITRHIRAHRLRVGEVETKDILRAYDLSVPDGAMANSPEEAVEIAERIGFPVAMKVVSVDIVHKSDVGGVKLNVAGAEDVRDTFDLLTLRVGRRAPNACLDGVYVEKMCGHGLEVILGMTCDPRFGPMLVFGLGGTFVDRLKGLSCHLAPVTAEEALEMLSQTRSYALLRGSLGRESIDISAIIGGLQRISQLATDFPQVKELSVDPYLVGPVGTEAMVVDARMTLFTSGNGR